MTLPPHSPGDDGIALVFPKGLLGFPTLRHFRLLEPHDGYPLKFLESLEDPEATFACLDPVVVKPDYALTLGPEASEMLELFTPEEALVLTLVALRDSAPRLTTNLAGPIVINIRTRRGCQVAQGAGEYPLRFPVPTGA
jgi:flagellar assembly factor FliW